MLFIHWDVGKVSSADLPPQTGVALTTSRVWTQQAWVLSVIVIEIKGYSVFSSADVAGVPLHLLPCRIVFSTPLAVLTYFLIWYVPPFEDGKIIWYLFFYCGFQTLQTVSAEAQTHVGTHARHHVTLHCKNETEIFPRIHIWVKKINGINWDELAEMYCF